tara:strand:- start:1717 stop:2115 length:399 start_codon:yes stop_codon:yes gene_type:complete
MMKNNEQLVKLAATGMVCMYLISGIMKVRSFGANESERFSKKAGTCIKNSQRIVFLAGIVEIYASFLILRGVWSTNMSLRDVKLGSSILSVFTVLATLIFYVIPGFRPYPVLSNLTALSGLLLLPLVCELRH